MAMGDWATAAAALSQGLHLDPRNDQMVRHWLAIIWKAACLDDDLAQRYKFEACLYNIVAYSVAYCILTSADEPPP